MPSFEPPDLDDRGVLVEDLRVLDVGGNHHGRVLGLGLEGVDLHPRDLPEQPVRDAVLLAADAVVGRVRVEHRHLQVAGAQPGVQALSLLSNWITWLLTTVPSLWPIR